MAKLKRCLTCKAEKSLEEFDDHIRGAYGKRSHCSTCYKARRAQKPCRGCGGEKELNRERAHFCISCTEHPLKRPLLFGLCKNGHDKSIVGVKKEGSKGHWKCAECLRINNVKKYSADPEKREKNRKAAWTSRIKKEYNLTPEQWLIIFNYQQGLCPICKKKLRITPADEGALCAVDHDHKTGLVRGILCQYPCNYTLGHLHDKIELFRSCADYLESPPAAKIFDPPIYTVPGKIGTKKRKKALKKFTSVQSTTPTTNSFRTIRSNK